MNEGRVSTLLGVKGIPDAAEDLAVYRDVNLAGITGGRIHIAHISTKGSVEIIRRAKEKGVRVTAETTPHYFSLTEKAVLGFNTLAKMNPPLRTEKDRMAIIEGIKDKTIDVIATDHAPHSILEKEVEFEKAANGIIGLETAVPLALELVRNGHISPLQMIQCMSTNPAKILGKGGGGLNKGDRADITVLDPEMKFKINPADIKSKGKNTPFLGKTLQGRALLTLVDGHPAYDPLRYL
jgi:dihydroorotase